MGYHDKNIFHKRQCSALCSWVSPGPRTVVDTKQGLTRYLGNKCMNCPDHEEGCWAITIPSENHPMSEGRWGRVPWGRAGEAEFPEEHLHFTEQVCSVGEAGCTPGPEGLLCINLSRGEERVRKLTFTSAYGEASIRQRFYVLIYVNIYKCEQTCTY